MRAFPRIRSPKAARGFVSALCSGLLAASLALASPAYAAGGGGGGGGGGDGAGGGRRRSPQTRPSPARSVPSDLTVCKPGQVWDTKRRKCLVRRSDVLPDPEMTEYAYALAKADRYKEAIDVLDLLDNPIPPRARYRGYATASLDAPTRGLTTTSSRSRSIPIIRRCASTWRSLCHRGQVRSGERAIVHNQEALQ